MKFLTTIGLLITLLLLRVPDIFAQQSMMSGIVLDEQNKLVPGAVIKITKRKEGIEVRVGEDGMYYSPLLDQGYYLIDIYVNNKYYTAKKVQLKSTINKTLFYNYRLKAGGTATLYTDEFDPLLRLKAGERTPQE
ncbi:MAG: carboxypeptidase-like regulatory domain-containing protein [Taibaiella sp.]|nr:carboxypeptidase-like regulatory domain-containing protein [Taibaiella sp.]